MSDNYDSAQALRAPSYERYLNWRLSVIQTSSPSVSGGLNTADDSTPCPEFDEYANKQSTMVNAGLEIDDQRTGRTVDAIFSTLNVPTDAPPPTRLPVVRTLLSPPPHAFLYGALSIRWALGAVGQAHVDIRASDEMYVLKPNSELRTQGKRMGLTEGYLEWLYGDEEWASPTDQSMLLTEQYFEESREKVLDDADE